MDQNISSLEYDNCRDLRSFPSIALRTVSHVISARALENGGFFFTAGPCHRSKSSFLRKRVW